MHVLCNDRVFFEMHVGGAFRFYIVNTIWTISSVVERSVHIGKATGSNPVSSTLK